jgi:class 3 adenylate cyclase
MDTSNQKETVFLIADLAGFTALTEAHGDMSAASIVSRFVEIVNDTLQPESHLIERTGDEVLIASNDAQSIVETAIHLRHTVERESDFPCVHAGIHAGSALKKDGHYFGRALNLTSRIAAHARGGEILCSEKIAASVKQLIGVQYHSLGQIQFKNISEPVSLYEILVEGHAGECTAFDPVCHMHVQSESATSHILFEDKIYYFCSFECAKLFANNPHRFVKQENSI